MRVRCRSTSLTEHDLARLGLQPTRGLLRDYAPFLTVGKEYVAFGLTATPCAPPLRTSPTVLIIPEVGYLTSLPLCLFTITDPRISRSWEAHAAADGTLHLRPPALQRDQFWEELADRIPETEAEFIRLHALLEGEFDDGR